jgi:hypothetical protein
MSDHVRYRRLSTRFVLAFWRAALASARGVKNFFGGRSPAASRPSAIAADYVDAVLTEAERAAVRYNR